MKMRQLNSKWNIVIRDPTTEAATLFHGFSSHNTAMKEKYEIIAYKKILVKKIQILNYVDLDTECKLDN